MLINCHKLECTYRDTIYTLESCSKIISYQPEQFLLSSTSLYTILNVMLPFSYHFPLFKLLGNLYLCNIS